MKSLRIVFLSSAQEMSAAYFRAFFLAKYLVERGHEVSLIATNRKATLDATKKLLDGVNVFLLPSLVASDANLLLTWLSRMSTGFMQTPFNSILQVTSNFDVLHSFNVMFPWTATPTLLSRFSRFLRIHNRKIFVDWDDWWGRGGLFSHYGGFYSLIDPLTTFLEEKVPVYADAVTVINETLKKRALSVGVKSQNLFIVTNGANTDFIKPLNISDARQKLNLPIKNVIHTHLGDLGQASIKLLMLAHRKVVRRYPNVLLLFVGLRRERIDFVKSLNVTKKVICIERQPYYKVPLYLGASDVFLLPMQDTLFNRAATPLRLCDYLAAGRPIIATALPEIEKIVCDCGFLARPGDPEDLADKILNIIGKPNLCKRMGKRARELAETKYSWRIAAKQLEKVYDQFEIS